MIPWEYMIAAARGKPDPGNGGRKKDAPPREDSSENRRDLRDASLKW